VSRLVSFVVLLAVAGCASGAALGGIPGGGATGEEAVRRYLEAATTKDLAGLAAVWGTEEAPLATRASRQEMERRSLIVMCHLRHDAAQVGVAEPGEAGRQRFRVELRQGERSATTSFTTVRNRRTGRWFVETFDMPAVATFCTH
jgi:hypothetical protein